MYPIPFQTSLFYQLNQLSYCQGKDFCLSGENVCQHFFKCLLFAGRLIFFHETWSGCKRHQGLSKNVKRLQVKGHLGSLEVKMRNHKKAYSSQSLSWIFMKLSQDVLYMIGHKSCTFLRNCRSFGVTRGKIVGFIGSLWTLFTFFTSLDYVQQFLYSAPIFVLYSDARLMAKQNILLKDRETEDKFFTFFKSMPCFGKSSSYFAIFPVD